MISGAVAELETAMMRMTFLTPGEGAAADVETISMTMTATAGTDVAATEMTIAVSDVEAATEMTITAGKTAVEAVTEMTTMAAVSGVEAATEMTTTAGVAKPDEISMRVLIYSQTLTFPTTTDPPLPKKEFTAPGAVRVPQSHPTHPPKPPQHKNSLQGAGKVPKTAYFLGIVFRRNVPKLVAKDGTDESQGWESFFFICCPRATVVGAYI